MTIMIICNLDVDGSLHNHQNKFHSRRTFFFPFDKARERAESRSTNDTILIEQSSVGLSF